MTRPAEQGGGVGGLDKLGGFVLQCSRKWLLSPKITKEKGGKEKMEKEEKVLEQLKEVHKEIKKLIEDLEEKGNQNLVEQLKEVHKEIKELNEAMKEFQRALRAARRRLRKPG